MNKPIKQGFGTIRNEEKCIRGWAKLMLLFCDKVTALIDPQTSDNTEKILKTEFPEIICEYQDRRLGDSDYGKEGKMKSLIMHNNHTKFVHERLEENEWFMTIAADERYSLESISALQDDLRYAQKHHFGAIASERLYEPLPLEASQIIRNANSTYAFDISVESFPQPNLFHYVVDYHDYCLRHVRIEQKTPNWEHKPGPHQGYSERCNTLVSAVPLWHFHRLKFECLNATDWRDFWHRLDEFKKKYRNKIPIMPMRLPFDDWTKGIEYTPKYEDLIAQTNFAYRQSYLERVLTIVRNQKELIQKEQNKIRLKNREDRERYIALGKYYQEHFDKDGNELS
jgi:hypothetical protein